MKKTRPEKIYHTKLVGILIIVLMFVYNSAAGEFYILNNPTSTFPSDDISGGGSRTYSYANSFWIRAYGWSDEEFSIQITNSSNPGVVALGGQNYNALGATRAKHYPLIFTGLGTTTITFSAIQNSNNAVLGTVTVTFTITASTLNITAQNKNKTYGSADPQFNYNVSGLRSGESATSIVSGSMLRAAGENVGTYAITPAAAFTINSPNYNLGTITNGTFTINKANITGVSLSPQSYVYDGTAKSLSISGNLPAGTSLNYANNTLTNAGTQEVTAYITGTNYNDLILKANLTINKAGITGVSLNPQSYVYDGTAKSLSINGNLPAGTSLSYANNTLTNVGTQEVTASITGSNYNDLTLKTNIAVTKKIVTIIATAVSKVYGNSDPVLAYTSSEALITGNNFSGTIVRAAGENVGSYNITQGTLTAGGNYQINYTGASLTITKAILTVTANNAQMCQGTGLPVFTTSYSGFKYNDNESSLNTQAKVNTTAISSSPVGNYLLVPAETASGNYSFNYVNGTLSINALPVVVITSSRGNSISKGESLQLIATGGASYIWSSTKGATSGPNNAILTIRPEQTATYSVTASNANGCGQSTSITIEVRDDFEMVKANNILTPNNDGYNDVWMVDNIDMYANNEVKIFDKTGRLLYSKKGYDNTWDGTVNGGPLIENTYYYVIDFGTAKPKQKGYITLIRQQ
ncbi:gliding motility-associated C-terminal domain-containing protein [Pedobacter hiemivivus]|uniref:Gliding motility-associated C-terminal domain-containing protein n=1 Tax=Pedobacter hiemivivus TaxID=2530454 RepID=A0A4V5PDJ7_9SPHI|nr:MBG domain-containing protein [Pedobacter hiemivivus]TKC65006.1 gliding motility-associated C-terminal domain-containing protein [Pedobacter hiemivivus]